jgi:hypothetical protein
VENLFEEVCAYEAFENLLLMDWADVTLHALLNPSTPLRVADMHEFHTDATAVAFSGDDCRLTRNVELSHLFWFDSSEWIYVCLQVTPPAEQVEDLRFSRSDFSSYCQAQPRLYEQQYPDYSQLTLCFAIGLILELCFMGVCRIAIWKC